MPSTSQRPSLEGILLVDKPVEWTSHDVVAKLRSVLRMRRIGHTGTLDPFATGLLVVCLNRSTRLVQFLTGHEKEYEATLRLGWQTETGDWTGKPVTIPTASTTISQSAIEAVLPSLRGRIWQTPPMYSARKQGGRKLYELAREGKVVERQAVEVEIWELALGGITLDAGEGDDPPTLRVEFRVVCSAGTYIRTLAEEIGTRLGVGAHLTALRRTRVGPCRIDAAHSLTEIAELAREDRMREILLPPVEVLDFAVVDVTPRETSAILQGQSIVVPGSWQDGERLSICDAGKRLLAIGVFDATTGRIVPRIVLGDSSGE
ncbi:MAG: tRNA pseudouridine(55) synthase TruB [Blastocatellia bacterium]